MAASDPLDRIEAALRKQKYWGEIDADALAAVAELRAEHDQLRKERDFYHEKLDRAKLSADLADDERDQLRAQLAEALEALKYVSNTSTGRIHSSANLFRMVRAVLAKHPEAQR